MSVKVVEWSQLTDVLLPNHFFNRFLLIRKMFIISDETREENDLHAINSGNDNRGEKQVSGTEKHRIVQLLTPSRPLNQTY